MKICSGGIGTIFERIFSAYQSAHMADIFGNIFFFTKYSSRQILVESSERRKHFLCKVQFLLMIFPDFNRWISTS